MSLKFQRSITDFPILISHFLAFIAVDTDDDNDGIPDDGKN